MLDLIEEIEYLSVVVGFFESVLYDNNGKYNLIKIFIEKFLFIENRILEYYKLM